MLLSLASFVVLTAYSLHIASAETTRTLAACRDSGYSFIGCENGAWPSRSDPAPAIKSNWDEFEVRNVSLQRDDFIPIPRFNALNILSFKSIITKDMTGKVAEFPLQNFTRLLDRSNVTNLLLEFVDLYTLSDTVFEGFVRLQWLRVRSCGVKAVHPRAFYALAPPADSAGQHTGLRKLEIVNETALNSFPWDSLLPLANSLEFFKIYFSTNLSDITYQLQNKSEPMRLKTLLSLDIITSLITTLPQEIVDTFAKGDVTVHLDDNRNQCDSCDLSALVRFARAYGRGGEVLFATCIASNGAKKLLGPNIEYWNSHPMPEICPTPGVSTTRSTASPRKTTRPSRTTTTEALATNSKAAQICTKSHIVILLLFRIPALL